MQRGVWEFQSRNEIWWRSALRQPRSASFSQTIQVLMVILWRFFLCNLSHNSVWSTCTDLDAVCVKLLLLLQLDVISLMLCNCFHCFKLFALLKLEHSFLLVIAPILTFYDSSNWAVLPTLHGSSIASTIPQIGHSSLDFIAAPLLALLTSDIPLSNHDSFA